MPQMPQQKNQQIIPADAWDTLPILNTARPGVDTSAPEDESTIEATLRNLFGLGVGAAKGVGDTTTSAVGMIPGVTKGTNAIGNAIGGELAKILYGEESVTPRINNAQVEDTFRPSNTAERIGKGAEQIGEFFLPAPGMRAGAIEGLVRMIPGSLSPANMAKANKAAAVVGRSLGEGASAYGVSKVQGETNPDVTTGIAAASPLVGSGIAKLLDSPLFQKSAAVGLSAIPSGLMPNGLAARMGTFTLIRKTLEDILGSKDVQRAVPRVAARVGQFTAGAQSQLDRK